MSRQTFDMKSEAESVSEEERSHCEFRCRVIRPNPAHVPAAMFWANFLDHFFIFQKNSLHLKMANFSSLKRRSIFTSRKILREKLEPHSTSKKSLNIAKMVEKRFELPTSTHDLSYEKIRLADCHKIPIFF